MLHVMDVSRSRTGVDMGDRNWLRWPWGRRTAAHKSDSGYSGKPKSSSTEEIVSTVIEMPSRSTYSDAEIQTFDEDKLDRGPFARRVAARIVAAGNGPSTVFGLAGKWGSGKSSTLNLIRYVIEQEHGQQARDGAWTVIAFTPWSCDDLTALTNEFYLAIATAMPQGADGERAKNLLAKATPFAAAVSKAAISSLVDKYMGEDAWNKVVKAGADSLADEAAKLAGEQPTFMQRFNETADAIEKAGHNVLVVIDDIDRLHADELLGVMKAVRLLGRFNRVHYLLSYDEATILDVLVGTDLARNDRGRARLYLEKIIQYPFALPPIQLPHLEAKLRTQLSAVAETYALPLKNSVKTWDAAVDRIVAGIPDLNRLTLRSIYRWCNQLDILLTLVGPLELDFADAALITYLRLWHNDVYLSLAAWRTELLDGLTGGRNELTEEQWVGRVRAVLDRAGDPAEAEEVTKLLADLFPRIRRQASFGRDGFAVSEREYFSRYFALGFPLGDVRDLDVRGELEWLAHNGSWSPKGLIPGSLLDPRTSYLVGTKALRALDVIQDAQSTSAMAGAQELMRLIRHPNHVSTAWVQVIYALLGRAVSSADGPATARTTVNQFVEEFGLAETSDILAKRLAYSMVDDDAMLAASADLRQAVLDACVRDLTTSESDDGGLTKLTIMRLLRYLDDELWKALREVAVERLQVGTSDIAELGARFVVIQPDALGGHGIHEFMTTEFGQLVPKETWADYQLPQVAEDEVDVRNASLTNRVAYAAVVLKKAIDDAAQQQ